jgi:hypothetical protein
MELDTVALVLKGRAAQPIEVRGKESEFDTTKEWMDKHSKAVKSISTGISLLVISILIGVAMAFFVPPNIPWMLAWAVLVGWMAMWGGIEVGNGIAGLFEAKSRLRMMGLWNKRFENDARADMLANQPPTASGPSPGSNAPHPSSVTEATTRHLDDSIKK